MKLLSDIIALSGWNTSMLMLLAKATFILVAALGITVAMQRASAGARHLVWLITLGALLLVPALATFTPLRLEILPARSEPASTIDATSPAVRLPASPASSGAPAVSVISPATPRSGPAAGITSVDGEFFTNMSGFSLLVAIWASIVLVIVASLGYGALMVRRIVRNSHALDSQDWLTPLYEVSDRLELDEPPRLLSSDDAKMPFACGFLTPTIVLPADCVTWTEDRRRAVLLHELAHVRRHDLIGHTLGRLACAVYWFHPLVWTAAKQLRNESERACDDLALSCGARASDYAEHLLDIVTSVRHDSTPIVALAMAQRKEFEGRMLAILDPELRHSTPTRRQSAALMGALALVSIVVGAAAPAPRAGKPAKAPVAMLNDAKLQAPGDFTPHDVAKPNLNKSEERSLSSAVNEVIQKSTQTLTQRTTIGSIGGRMAEAGPNSVTISRADADADTGPQVRPKVRPEIDLNGIAAKAIAQLGGSALSRSQKSDDRPALLANVLRTDSSASLRRIAAWGLSEYADQQIAAEALARALRSDADASVREMAAWALAEGDEHSAVATTALVGALKTDSKEAVRVIAAWALGSLGDRDGVAALAAAVSDANPAVRMRAIWGIGSIGPRTAPTPVLAALKDRDPEVRELAAWALYQMEDASAVPALNAALHSETDKNLQIAYIRALAAIGEESVDAIRNLLTSPDPRIKSMAVRALAGGNAAGPWPWPWPEPRPFP